MPRVSGWLKIVLIGIIGAFFLVSLLSSQTITAQALDFTLKAVIALPGYTELAVPPLGSLRAKTHSLPLRFSISLNNINLERLRTLIAEKNEGVFAALVESFRAQVGLFIAKVLVLAFLGGLLAGFVLLRRLRPSLAAGVVGLVAVGALLAGTALSFHEDAFTEPEFHGIVEVAPWLIGVAEEALLAVNELDSTLEIVAANMMHLFDSLGQLATPKTANSGLKILHVSDIHNNPLAVALVNQAAAAFQVDLIIDTGDITDYGTPIEGDLAANIARSGLPWLFVPGNHDSPAVIEILDQLDNVTVLNGDVVHLEPFNLSLAGIADPSADDWGMGIPSREQYIEAASRLKAIIADSGLQPTIIAAHHPYILEEFRDLPVVLLHGHSHRNNLRRLGEAIIIDAGTTGGAGIRGLMSAAQVPYTMVLLHLEWEEAGWAATAADFITINQLNASFTLERKLLATAPEQAPRSGPAEIPED